jgi:glycosyltransferase involved in cell wall biosynthesis
MTDTNSIDQKKRQDHVPTVSIGMPVYNGERYLRETLDSILLQTFSDFELIISDNASTDGTRRICEEYMLQDNRIRYFLQPVNKGASWNFRFVLDQSRGEFFMWAAADDWRFPNFIDDAMRSYQIDPSLLCVQGSTDFMAGNRLVFRLNSAKIFKRGSHISFFFARELYGKCMLMYGLFKKKSLYKADWTQLQGEKNWWWNDTLFLYSLLSEGGMAFMQFPSMRYLLKTTKKDRQYASVTSVKRSALLGLISFHPLSYYADYLSLTPSRQRICIALTVPFKMVKATIEAWFFYAYKRRK